MGAWIEIFQPFGSQPGEPVAPYMGAWIEIPSTSIVAVSFSSLPTWERGLKFCIEGEID